MDAMPTLMELNQYFYLVNSIGNSIMVGNSAIIMTLLLYWKLNQCRKRHHYFELVTLLYLSYYIM